MTGIKWERENNGHGLQGQLMSRKHRKTNGEIVLSNDALKTFYLWFICIDSIEHMLKDHSNSETGNQLLPFYGLPFLISSKSSFYMHQHKRDNTYLNYFYTSHGTLVGMSNSSVGPP